MVVDRQTNDPQEVENRSGPQTKDSEGEKTDEFGRNPNHGTPATTRVSRISLTRGDQIQLGSGFSPAR